MLFMQGPFTYAFLAFHCACAATLVQGNSEIWTYRPNFFYDAWNEPILPYRATIPPGEIVNTENVRAFVAHTALVKMRLEAEKAPQKRLVRRQVLDEFRTSRDVERARKYLLPQQEGVFVDVFQIAAGYVDRFGLLSIMQSVARWQCAANERCPERVTGKLEILLASGGRIMKTETFAFIEREPWIVATISYEVSVGQEIRVVPLRSRKLQVEEET